MVTDDHDESGKKLPLILLFFIWDYATLASLHRFHVRFTIPIVLSVCVQ